MPIISIANQKGGCGKTTTAINLASSLAANQRKVLLIDLDPQSHASLGLNIEPSDSIYNVISKISPRKLQIKDIIKNVEQNFDLIPSNVLVGTLEQELADEIGRELKLVEALQPVQDEYDYIIIDCPPSLGFLSVNALRASSQVIIPVEPSRFSLQGVERLMDIVNLIRDRLNHNIQYRVLVTMFDSRLKHCFTMLEKIKDLYDSAMFNTIVHVNVKLKESVLDGKTVGQFDKYCRGAKDYFSLAKELMYSLGDKRMVLRPMSRRMKKLLKDQADGFKRYVTFVLSAPEAQSVYVTGSFNGWSLDEAYRMKQENGRFALRIPLSSGVYRYRYIVDGVWQEDPNNSLKEKDALGIVNSVIEIK